MDWARDNASLSEKDLINVFRYVPRESTAIRMLASTEWRGEISTCEGQKAWYAWTENELPQIDGDDSGLILILAKRSGEPSLGALQKATPDDWLHANKSNAQQWGMRRANTFAPLHKNPLLDNVETHSKSTSGRRDVRTLPFSQDTFENLTAKLHIHGSFARVVSRADVPVITCDKVNMSQPAYVCNYRTSNAWDTDLALSLTHFPSRCLTFAIVFGCTASVERDIITRLVTLRSEVAYPLIVPGILVEIEQARHARLVDEIVDQVETHILELDTPMNDLDGPRGEEAERKAREKRSAYLDIAYLRNGLVSWDTQLSRMLQHCRRLSEEYSGSNIKTLVTQRPWQRFESEELAERLYRSEDNGFVSPEKRDYQPRQTSISEYVTQQESTSLIPQDIVRDVGRKMEGRITSLRDEYDDMIRDCTMRVDGMAMATQWAHGETNLEIALATNKDSKHMRSIALVTMIFLPGTFFASMFSMTFFNWSGDNESPTVSIWLWIYFLFTVVFTGMTIGLWYYIVIFRPSRQCMKTDEEELQIKVREKWKAKHSRPNFSKWRARLNCGIWKTR